MKTQTRRLHYLHRPASAITCAIATLTCSSAFAQTEGNTIRASDAAIGDNFGKSVGISGNTVIVGAHLSAANDSGAAYVFVNGLEQQKLTGDPDPGDQFGYSVAIDGDTAVIGAPFDSGAGAVYVFTRSGTTWTQQAKLTGNPNDRFGDAVAIEGDRLVVGATQQSHGGGTAYVFDRSGTIWTLNVNFTPGTITLGEDFGYSVSLSGDTVAVGARNDAGTGAVYVWSHDGVSWSAPTILVGGDSAPGDQFGYSVAIKGNRLAVGAPLNEGSGALYVFDRSGGTWNQTSEVRSAATNPGDLLGESIDVDGDVLVGGARTGFFGSGYVAIFQRSGGSWLEDTLTSPSSPSLGGSDDQFGTSVALEGALVIGGAPGNDNFGFPTDNFGSATFFQVDPLPSIGDSDGDGLSDALELAIANGSGCPDPNNADTDGDGLNDGHENTFGPNTCVADTDTDGLLDGAEVLTHGTNPTDCDTDDDGLLDGMEIAFGTNPHVADTDGDGLSDGSEVTLAAGCGCPNPLLVDSDGDSLTDFFEHNANLDPCDADSDGDGLSDDDEINNTGTNPALADTDGDNLDDGDEVAMAAGGSCPDPLNPDSDNDGIEDGDELTFGGGPCDNDTDNDGLSDGNELVHGTQVYNPDTDGDGLLDGAEVDAAMGGNCPSPLDPDSDNDGLNDAAEIALATSLCNPDTDGDGLNDSVDPNPLTPQVTPAALASLTLATAGEFIDTPTNQFLGPNNVVRDVRRATLAATTALAAVAIQVGSYNAAAALLQTVENFTDGVSPPPDWMANGPTKTQIHEDVQTLLILLDLLD